MTIILEDSDIRKIIADKFNVDPEDIDFSAKEKEEDSGIVDVKFTAVSAVITTEV
jgi:hypothetical protein